MKDTSGLAVLDDEAMVVPPFFVAALFIYSLNKFRFVLTLFEVYESPTLKLSVDVYFEAICFKFHHHFNCC